MFSVRKLTRIEFVSKMRGGRANVAAAAAARNNRAKNEGPDFKRKKTFNN